MVNDPNILLSIINTKLRDYYSNLDDLCEDLSYDKDEVINLLLSINYVYNSNSNQFVLK